MGILASFPPFSVPCNQKQCGPGNEHANQPRPVAWDEANHELEVGVDWDEANHELEVGVDWDEANHELEVGVA